MGEEGYNWHIKNYIQETKMRIITHEPFPKDFIYMCWTLKHTCRINYFLPGQRGTCALHQAGKENIFVFIHTENSYNI